MNLPEVEKCPVCLNTSFNQGIVLWPGLIKEWGLNQYEVDYINQQQGMSCAQCGCNLRSMSLAAGLLSHYKYHGSFDDFCKMSQKAQTLTVLEINTASSLAGYLACFKNHKLAAYPDIDIQNMTFDDSSFDLVIHSDTMEHIPDSVRALSECYRILTPGGLLAYTIPIIYGRMTKVRDPREQSYHGSPNAGSDYLVIREYGADFWVELVQAGFSEIKLHTISELSSIAVMAVK
jgi:SAM-dependent methyltransferase